MEIWIMEFLECVPAECWKSLTSLESLHIGACRALTSLSKAKRLHHHHHLWVCGINPTRWISILGIPRSCIYPITAKSGGQQPHLGTSRRGGDLIILDSHGGLHHGLRSVTLFDLPKLASLPVASLRPAISASPIIRCYNLKELRSGSRPFNHFNGFTSAVPLVDIITPFLYEWEGLHPLLTRISDCEELESFKTKAATTTSSWIPMEDFTGLPEQIEALQSLRQLRIFYCPSAMSLPKDAKARVPYSPEILIARVERRCKRWRRG
ncbi:hypothetical protein NL676_029711 [Syzygium grande]|nr:hypothetical protein NL676_029711 [Syzygium grande]